VRAELLPTLPARRPLPGAGRHIDLPRWFPLHRAALNEAGVTWKKYSSAVPRSPPAEVKHVPWKDFHQAIIHILTSKNETSTRLIPLNDSALDAAGLPAYGSTICDTVVTAPLKSGGPDRVVESITNPSLALAAARAEPHRRLTPSMLEHYAHIRLNANKAALGRVDASGKTSLQNTGGGSGI
jgi:hypothetical protein